MRCYYDALMLLVRIYEETRNGGRLRTSTRMEIRAHLADIHEEMRLYVERRELLEGDVLPLPQEVHDAV